MKKFTKEITNELNGLKPLIEKLDYKISKYISLLQNHQQIEQKYGITWFNNTEISTEKVSTLIPEDSPVEWLKNTFQLSSFDLDIIAITIAPELNREYERIYVHIQGEKQLKQPTIDLALNLYYTDTHQRLNKRKHFTRDAPLRSHGLLYLSSESTSLARKLIINPQVVRLLLQPSGLDSRLTSYCQLIQAKLYSNILSLPKNTQNKLLTLVKQDWQQKQEVESPSIKDSAIFVEESNNQPIPEKPQPSFTDLCTAARNQSGHHLTTLARKIESKYAWEDIVVQPNQLTQLKDICKEAQYQNLVHHQWGFAAKLSLGKGLNVLFSGSPGTGKTMAAEVIAHELQLDLYKIDLSQIVSKYIGETEKNLNRIFTAAANSNAILLFDEADALFGKRSEIQDSRDRYANIEVSYLLQKMEEYEGIAILTTNLRSNMDEAFERRLRFIIEFSLPDAKNRLQIWQKIFPKNAPCSPDIDLEFLAENLEITGANISNIALTAAFLATDGGAVLKMSHLIQAIRREYQKMGRILRDKNLGQ